MDGPDNVPNSGDDDGTVDLVMFVHPNEGGECGGSEIWSHSFSYSGWAQHGQPFVTDDIGANGQPLLVDDYVIMPALSCFAGRIEIGVFSHEFGHALGLPDLYDRTAYDPAGTVSTGGMGLYCLMAAGAYGGDYAHPATPTQMCAWSKEELGWLAPREIVCDETAPLYYQGDAAEAVKLWRGGDYSQNEWFLVENRQRKKWDQYLLGTGFLITHIDNNVLTQNDESCPTGNPCPTGHNQVMVIEADNQWEMQIAAPPVVGPWFGEGGGFLQRREQRQLGRYDVALVARSRRRSHRSQRPQHRTERPKDAGELQRRSGLRHRALALRVLLPCFRRAAIWTASSIQAKPSASRSRSATGPQRLRRPGSAAPSPASTPCSPWWRGRCSSRTSGAASSAAPSCRSVSTGTPAPSVAPRPRWPSISPRREATR